jgi:hypothetical protein
VLLEGDVAVTNLRELTMTFRMSLIAAVLLLSATAAYAGPAPTTTDEARAIAGRALPSSEARPAVTRDRALGSTDQARAAGSGGDRASQPSGGEKTACGPSCGCKHG